MRLGVYFGSCADVAPVFIAPEVDWILVTPEPSHPVAVAHWPKECCGHALGFCNPVSFHRMFHDRLTSRGYEADGDWRWKNAYERTLRVFPNCTVEDVPSDAKELLAQCTVAFVQGFLPDKVAFRRLCPDVDVAYVANHLVDNDKLIDCATIHPFPEGGWHPCDGLYFVDYGDTPRQWKYEIVEGKSTGSEEG